MSKSWCTYLIASRPTYKCPSKHGTCCKSTNIKCEHPSWASCSHVLSTNHTWKDAWSSSKSRMITSLKSNQIQKKKLLILLYCFIWYFGQQYRIWQQRVNIFYHFECKTQSKKPTFLVIFFLKIPTQKAFIWFLKLPTQKFFFFWGNFVSKN